MDDVPVRSASLVLDPFRDGAGGVVVELFGDALVGVAGQGRGGVPELFGDDFDVDAGVQGDGGGAVTQIVEPYGW